MCYYARTDYRCGDWKWGNMKVRCPRQPRMGEHCQAKLVDTENLTFIDEDCRLCQDIQTKTRRLRKEQDNISRWKSDNRNNFRASIEKAERESQQLQEAIREMTQRRPAVKLSKGADPEPGKPQTRSRPASFSSHKPSGSRHGGYSSMREPPRDHDRHGGGHHSGSGSRNTNSYGSHGGHRHS